MLYMQHTFPLKVIDLSIRLMCILLIKSFSNWWKNISRKQYNKIDTFAYAHAIIITQKNSTRLFNKNKYY